MIHFLFFFGLFFGSSTICMQKEHTQKEKRRTFGELLKKKSSAPSSPRSPRSPKGGSPGRRAIIHFYLEQKGESFVLSEENFFKKCQEYRINTAQLINEAQRYSGGRNKAIVIILNGLVPVTTVTTQKEYKAKFHRKKSK